MNEVLLQVLESSYFWIAMETIAIVILAFLVRKNSMRRKAIQEDIEQKMRADKYRELDEKLGNPWRSRK